MTDLNLTGQHFIAGNWLSGDAMFDSAPSTGPVRRFSEASQSHVDAAVEAAEEAFMSYGWSGQSARAAFLRAIADEIEAVGALVTEIGHQETGLPEARLEGERGRTTGQLRLFADHIEQGSYLDQRHDVALPDRTPLPRPDLRLMQRPIGPVAVFGASNFPLAFSTAGGDTAAALAAGCPVVLKGHPAHPGTGEIIAQAIARAMKATDQHPGVFSFLQGSTHEVGAQVVQHPLIRAVGFTGSLAGGRALFDLCMNRSEPIPFFGELGSVNPMFCLPQAMQTRAVALAKGWAASLTMGAGQFCTNPGIAFVIAGAQANEFSEASIAALSAAGAEAMLTDGIAAAYRHGANAVASAAHVEPLFTTESVGRTALPNLFRISMEHWLRSPDLQNEVFGPFGIIVEANDLDEMVAAAGAIEGQLTCTLQMEEGDKAHAKRLLPHLERKAGRVLVNGFPTGVEVAGAMVHGGPYPASTNFGATSVGTMAIRRFLRPVCYQNMPADLLPV